MVSRTIGTIRQIHEYVKAESYIITYIRSQKQGSEGHSPLEAVYRGVYFQITRLMPAIKFTSYIAT